MLKPAYHWPGNIRGEEPSSGQPYVRKAGQQEKDVHFDSPPQGVGPLADYFPLPYNDAKEAYLKDYPCRAGAQPGQRDARP